MNARCFYWSLGLLFAPCGFAQAQVTLTARDMFNEPGLYYRAYANDPNVPVAAGNLIKEKGGPRLWDFSTGPTFQVFRFDYQEPGNNIRSATFPEATIVEVKTEEVDNRLSYLYFHQVQGVGRQVYGFWDDEFGDLNPAHIFNPPIVDFPATINFGDTWGTSTTFDVNSSILLGLPTRLTMISEFEVDAFGIVDLPELGFTDVLRINEFVINSFSVDINNEGQFTPALESYVRNYYWISPGRGIVAQLNSVESTSPIPDVFNEGKVFVRMFETNKVTAPGCTEANPVTDLRISLNSNRVLLRWTQTECTKTYRVEYSSAPFLGQNWTLLGTTDGDFITDDNVQSDSMRMYRVISLK